MSGFIPLQLAIVAAIAFCIGVQPGFALIMPNWTPMDILLGTLALLYVSQIKGKIIQQGHICIPDPSIIAAVTINLNFLLGLAIWLMETWFEIACYSIDRVSVPSKNGDRRMVLGSRYRHPVLNKIRSSSLETLISTFQIHLVNTTLEAQYIGQPNFNETPLDEYKGLMECETVMKDVNDTWDVQTFLVWVAVAALSAVQAGLAGPMIVITAYVTFRNTKLDVRKAQRDPGAIVDGGIPIQDGVYRIINNPLGIPLHRGIGYMQKGVFYSRYHVTNGCCLRFNESYTYAPTYINSAADTITYGGNPAFVRAVDGEELTAAVASSTSNAIILYKTIISIDENGVMVFRGNRSVPGTSGSPIFKRITTQISTDFGTENHVEYKIAGILGWSYAPMDTPKTSVELYQENATTGTTNIQITDNDIVQVFSHPGSGKTRTVMPSLLQEGLTRYGKVYITGPTRVVCRELYDTLSETMPDQVALMTSDADYMARGTSARPVIIAAHATMLSMVLKGSTVTSARGLWVMDESHFFQPASLMLKDYLRDLVRSKHRGALVEMTATGYNIRSQTLEIKSGSNFPVEDVRMSASDMIVDMMEKAKNHKVIAFVTAVRGRRDARTSASLKATAQKQGVPFVELSRNTFNKAYPEAKNLELGLILTTDISECGINLNADYVYDFQMSAKAIKHGNHVMHEMRAIDETQKTQRRGRVGRRKPGTYIYPDNVSVMESDPHRVEHYDRQVFANTYSIDILDPIPVGALTRDSLTPPQLLYWLGGGESSLNGVQTVNLFITPSGKIRTRESLYEHAKRWYTEGNIPVEIQGKTISTLMFWDERDRRRLEDLLYDRGVITTTSNHTTPTTLARMFHTLSSIKGSIVGAPEPVSVDEHAVDVAREADEPGGM